MDKLKYVKLENPDGTYSDSIPLSVDSNYIDVNGNPLTSELNKKATKTEISELTIKINSLASGSPAGVYSTVSDLISQNPDHSKIYLVVLDGKWYYYNDLTDLWTAGGIYQSAGVDLDVSLDVKTKAPNSQVVGSRMKLLDSIIGNKFDSSIFENGGISDYGTDNNNMLYRFRSKEILYCNDDIEIQVPSGIILGYFTYQSDGTTIAWQGWKNTYQIMQVTIPKNTYFRLIFKRYQENTEEVIDYTPIVNQMNILIYNNKIQKIINNYVSNQLDINNFINADIQSGNLILTSLFRIASYYIFEFPDDTMIEIPYGYKCGYWSYDRITLQATWSGWKHTDTNLTIPKNTLIRLLIAQNTDVQQSTLSIENTIPLFKCHSTRINTEIGNIVNSYGATRITVPSTDKILFSFGNNYTINVTFTGNKAFAFLPSDVANIAFKEITLSTTSFEIQNNNLLVYDIINNQLTTKTQSQFVQNRNNFIILLWNSYGNIKGQFLDYYLEYYIKSTVNTSNESNTIEIVSRQGQVDGYPENTLQGFKRAKQFGYNHIRISIGWTSDNIPICSHFDKVAGSTLRNIDGTEVQDETIMLSNLTYDYIVEHYDAGIYKGSQFAGIPVPTLESVLKQAKQLNQKIDLEYKFGYSENNLNNLLEMIYQLGLQDVTCYLSTSHGQLYQIKNSNLKIKIGLCQHFTQEQVTAAKTIGVDEMCIFDIDTYDSSLVLDLHKNNIKVKIGSSYQFSTAIDYIEKYDIIECANQINPIIAINQSL